MRVVPVHAFGIAATLRPRDVAAHFDWTSTDLESKVRIAKTFVMMHQEGDRYVVIHDFGAIVFFDWPIKEQRDAFLEKLLSMLPPEPHPPLLDDYLVEVREGAEPKVGFDRAVVPVLDAPAVELFALVLAQSVAMDYFEEDVRAAYAKVDGLATQVAETGRIRLDERELNLFTGQVLTVRNDIAMTASLLDAPDVTWEREPEDRLFRALRAVFEIEDRYRTLEHKIALIQDNLSILVNLFQHRRAHRLEWAIVLMIAFEVVFAIVDKILLRP